MQFKNVLNLIFFLIISSFIIYIFIPPSPIYFIGGMRPASQDKSGGYSIYNSDTLNCPKDTLVSKIKKQDFFYQFIENGVFISDTIICDNETLQVEINFVENNMKDKIIVYNISFSDNPVYDDKEHLHLEQNYLECIRKSIIDKLR